MLSINKLQLMFLNFVANLFGWVVTEYEIDIDGVSERLVLERAFKK